VGAATSALSGARLRVPVRAAVTAALALVAVTAPAARADPDSCTALSSGGGRFAACFDPGNRLSLTAGSEGVGAGIAVRGTIDFVDEPDLVWKMDHAIAEATFALGDAGGTTDGAFTATLYRGRFLRHARDGHIVIPLGGTPKKVFLPFDIGALVEVGHLYWLPSARSDLQVIETAALVDFARTRDFRTRFAIGPVASWDVAFDHGAAAGTAQMPLTVADQRIAPFSALLADLHVESHDGLTLADARLEAGTAWHSTSGWSPHARAEAVLERVVLAVNDRPVALFANAIYDNDTGEKIAGVGLRVVLVQRRDPRVSLSPPAAR
jgi:hypothetical protein